MEAPFPDRPRHGTTSIKAPSCGLGEGSDPLGVQQAKRCKHWRNNNALRLIGQKILFNWMVGWKQRRSICNQKHEANHSTASITIELGGLRTHRLDLPLFTLCRIVWVIALALAGLEKFAWRTVTKWNGQFEYVRRYASGNNYLVDDWLVNEFHKDIYVMGMCRELCTVREICKDTIRKRHKQNS